MITVKRISAIFYFVNTAYYDGDTEDIILSVYSDPLESLVARLHIANIEVWRREDAVRSGVDAARLTQERQEWNRRRTGLVWAIDQIIHAKCRGGKMHTESPGMIIDRLSILELKRFHGADTIEDFTVLSDSFRTFLDDILSGRKCFHLFQPTKIYADKSKSKLSEDNGGSNA